LVCIFCFHSGVQAQMKDTGAYIGAAASYVWENFESDFDTDSLPGGGGDVKIDNAYGVNLYAGYRFVKFFSAEANFNWYDSFDVKTGSGTYDLDIWTLMIDGKLMCPLFDARFVPYFRFGGGFVSTELENEDEEDFGWNLGGGLDFFITPSVSIGVDGKYVWGTGDLDELEYFVGTMGIGFHF